MKFKLAYICLVMSLLFLPSNLIAESCSNGGPYNVDGNTLLLLKFDGDYLGVQGETPTVNSGPELRAGKFSQGAFFGESDDLHYDPTGSIELAEGTVEFWVQPDWIGFEDRIHTFFEIGYGFWADRLKIAWDTVSIRVQTFDSTGESGIATFAANWVPGDWHHVAFTWNGTEMEFYVDLKLIGAITADHFPITLDSPIRLGFACDWGAVNCEPSQYQGAYAVLDEFRISNVARCFEETVDSDGDGVPDDEDICPGGDDNIDADGDLVPDYCDPCPLDADNDADGDGVCGDSDVCPGGDDNIDGDYDSMPDFCDVCPFDPENDADGDGICEADDNCEVVFNPDQMNTDGDEFGDACDTDIDNDAVLNDFDNCPYDANSGQEDWDADGIGDVCDDDFDGDGVQDDEDQCLNTLPGDAVNEYGCSIAELCPCEHPVGGSKWKNHGAYMKCIAHASGAFVELDLISEEEKGSIVSASAQSECGKKSK